MPGVTTTGVGVREGKPVGNELGVANWNRGVAVDPDVTVADPSNTSGVGLGPGRGGFCQM